MLLASVLGSSLAPFMVSALVVALPSIADEFGAGAVSLGLLTNVFFLSAAAFLVPLGRIADLFGAKKVFLAGLGVYLISSLLCIFAPSLPFLIAARFVTGIGGGMIFGTSIALLSLAFPESERGRAIGINVTGMFVGFLLGFLLGGILTFYAGWRSIFAVTVPVELAAIGIVLGLVRGECELSRRRGLDVPGMVLYSLSLLVLVTGFSMLPGFTGVLVTAGGVAILALFSLRELRAGEPVLDLRLLSRNRTFAMAALAALLFNVSNFAVIFLLSLYLQDIRGFDARFSGLILLTLVIFMALFSAYAGKRSDRSSPRVVIGTGVCLSTAGLLFLTFLDGTTPVPVLVLALAVMGTGFAFFQSPLLRTLVSSVPREMFGLASGLAETMRLVGMTASIAIATILLRESIGGMHVTPAILPGFVGAVRLTFWIFAGISLASLAAVLFLRNRPVSGEQGDEAPEKR